MILLLNPAQNYILGVIVGNENWGMEYISWGSVIGYQLSVGAM